jgi:hypothetical protein
MRQQDEQNPVQSIHKKYKYKHIQIIPDKYICGCLLLCILCISSIHRAQIHF